MSRRARPGLTLKLAWRQVLRTKGSSLLVAALIAVPVAGAAGVLTFLESRTPSPEQAVTLELGETQSWIRVAGPPDPSRRQAVDMPQLTTYGEDAPDAGEAAPTDLSGAGLPARAETIPIVAGSARMVTRDGVASFPVVYGDAWDRRLHGRFEVLSGQKPQASDEAMASPDLLERLGAEVGDVVSLPDQGLAVRVVGVMRALDGSAGTRTLFLPSAAIDPGAAATPDTMWFLPDWQPDMTQLTALNRAGYVAYARDLVLDPPAGADTRATMLAGESNWVLFMLVTLGLVFGGVLVGLLAAASMAVSARRQQRALAVATTIGARRSDVFRLVLTQGGLLGLAGGIVGSAAGIGSVALILAVLDPGVENLMFSSWALKVPWGVTGVVLFAMLVGLAASALPARAATHGDALAALRGARRPVRFSRRQPVWGVVILVVGAATVAVAGAVFAFNGTQSYQDSGLQLAALWTAIIGVLVLLLGVAVTGQGILLALAGLLARCGPAARLASRDAVANSPRTVPAFVSIAASAAAAAFVLCAIALTGAQAERLYAWSGPAGSVVVQNWGEVTDAGAPEFLTDAGPERVIPVATAPEPAPPEAGTAGQDSAIVHLSYQGPDTGGTWTAVIGSPVHVVATEDVEQLTGIRLSDSERDEFASGRALAMVRDRMPSAGRHTHVSGSDTVRLDYWAPETIHSIGGPEQPEPERSVEIPADVHVGTGSAYPVLLSPAGAEKLGIATETRTWVGVFAEPPAQAMMDRLRADAETASVAGSSFDVFAENGPDSPLPWLALVLGILSVIVISAASISLGLARIERAEDDATLAAVGATARLRRRVSAWQAVIIVGVGCVTGVGLGIIGAWVLTQAAPDMLLTDLPAPWLLAIAVGLPLVIAVVSLLIRPPQAALTRRTAIA